MEKKQRVSARDRILDTASALFYKRGINNTGIDRIIADAGVAKASMYNNFQSKEEIVASYLRRIREGFDAALDSATAQDGASVEIPFRLLKMTLDSGDFFGCPFANALVEMPDSELVRKEVTAYRNRVENYFAASVGADAEKTAKLMLVYDGAFLNCKLSPNPNTVGSAIQLANSIATT